MAPSTSQATDRQNQPASRLLNRPLYMDKLTSYLNTDFIKVITGVRRSGKSYLLLLLKEHLQNQGVPGSHIIYLSFEDPENFALLEGKDLYNFLREQAQQNTENSHPYYFLFDEIQEVSGWQKIVNGLRLLCPCDIYLTGSNASLLSGELTTYLAGRYVEIPILPLSFTEFKAFSPISHEHDEDYLTDYLEYGGFPSIALQSSPNLKDDALKGIYNSIVLHDVISRATVREPQILQKVALFLLDNIGNLVNTNKIANTLRTSGQKASNNTIDSYMDLLENAFLFYPAPRYNIRGKEFLARSAKYYTVDLGFVHSQIARRGRNYGSRLENLVYLELRRRGYTVSVGQLDGKEIDFVAEKPDQTAYLQIADHIPENSQRETDNLLAIPTGHQRFLITNSWSDVGSVDGITIMHVLDFLNGKELG